LTVGVNGPIVGDKSQISGVGDSVGTRTSTVAVGAIAVGDGAGSVAIVVGDSVGVAATVVSDGWVGMTVGRGDLVAAGATVGVELGVGIGVFTVLEVNGPPLTITAFVCARPYVPSPRTEAGPSFAHVGTLR
jgi:hypothetical protein